VARAGKGLKVFLVVVVVLVVILGGSIAVLVKYANKIMKSELESRLGKSFAIERIDLKWGHVEVVGIKLTNSAGKEVVRVGDLSVTADFMGLLRKEYVISNITLKDAYLFVEIDNKGNLVNPILPPELTPAQRTKEKKAAQSASPVVIKKIEVVNASVDYLDRKTPATPVLTKMRKIDLVMNDVSVPFADGFSDYNLSANIPGSQGAGTLKSKGKVKIKTTDMDMKASLRGLDITAFKPYFQKQNPVDITRGHLDLDVDVKVVSQKLHAPGMAVLKDLQFQSGPGMGSKFMGLPLSLVVALLKKNDDEIQVNFVMEGDLKNPKFDVKENLMDRISVALADKLGLPIKGIAEALGGLGAKGTADVGSAAKEIGGAIRKLFK
jgi:uncharacterized protein involved in outer membrane biogenesis